MRLFHWKKKKSLKFISLKIAITFIDSPICISLIFTLYLNLHWCKSIYFFGITRSSNIPTRALLYYSDKMLRGIYENSRIVSTRAWTAWVHSFCGYFTARQIFWSTFRVRSPPEIQGTFVRTRTILLHGCCTGP